MRIIVTLAALAMSAALSAQQPLALDRAATAMANQEASFTHTFTPKGFRTSQVERGTVLFGRLPAMRWSYTAPEQKLFVFDGNQSWFYVPGDRQVTQARVTDARKRELPFLLLGDPAARERHFVVRQQTARGGTVTTTLQPRAANAVVRSVTVTTSSNNLIQRIDYTDRQGNRTTFEFSGYHPKSAGADSFRFTPPAGVQVVNAD